MRWGSPPIKGDTHIHIYMQSTPDIYMVNICCDKVISWVIFYILKGHYHPRSRLINTFHIRFHRYSNFLRFVRKPWGTSEGGNKGNKVLFCSVTSELMDVWFLTWGKKLSWKKKLSSQIFFSFLPKLLKHVKLFCLLEIKKITCFSHMEKKTGT